MRRAPKKKIQKLAGDALRIANLASAVSQAGSRLEDQDWQNLLDELIAKNLEARHQSILDAAAEHVFTNQPEAYEVLIEAIESIATSGHQEAGDTDYELLLVAAPILAWSRFDIASGPIPAPIVKSLSLSWRESLLCKGVQVSLLPTLYSIDQLPQDHCAVNELLHHTAQNFLRNKNNSSPKELPKTVPFLADSRYLLGVILAPTNAPVFQWQLTAPPFDIAKAKEAALLLWKQRAHADVGHLLPGCGFEFLLPEAYYSACREADILIRPISIRATVFYLTQTLNIEASELSAVVARFGPELNPGQVDEIRIGFTLKKASDIIYGVIWPLYQQEDEVNALVGANSANVEQRAGEIPTLLKESGIQQILVLEDIFGLEFCDDCQAPLYADAEGDLVHPEMPEDAPPEGSVHLH
ncbi:DUF2863 family protein [Undibacterium fentianense]|uniref:DUF2863 family protein n=1 Tax=Undibacterium fentianense TaxID=2828728 RepID=A0A941E0B2_9BURK|nr:DUF2863 family protein [Undibacterium fentianense]MBR7798672.1 DUF2863 family protein [Undibacterium fentianense]